MQGETARLVGSSNLFGLSGHEANAATLTEENCFGPDGWLRKPFLDSVKKDLYVVFDVGWVVAQNTPFDSNQWMLGTLIPAEDKFPSCKGTPAQKLATLNRMTKEACWRGAVLGCAIGVMDFEEGDHYCGKDFARAIRLQRLMPAFGVGAVKTVCSTDRLEDSALIEEGNDWIDWKFGQTLKQSAPAVVARGTELPDVACDGIAPFVVAGFSPNGTTAIGTLPGRTVETGVVYPEATVRFDVSGSNGTVGIFVEFKELILTCAADPVRVLAQDIAEDSPVNITDRILINDNKLRIPGNLLHELCKHTGIPGVVVTLGPTH